jgi:hypothetical protein
MNNEIEMEEILNIVEALHTLAQLGIESDDSLPLAKEISTMLTTVEHPICANTTVAQENEIKTEENSRPKRKKNFGSRSSRFQVRDVKRRLQEAILQFDVTDMLGYDPTKHQVPLTDAKHCAHCISPVIGFLLFQPCCLCLYNINARRIYHFPRWQSESSRCGKLRRL